MIEKKLNRTLSRLAAVQSLYSLCINNELHEFKKNDDNTKIDKAIADICTFYRNKDEESYNINYPFLKRLANLTAKNLEVIYCQIDSYINKDRYADKMHMLLKSIIANAICEILYFNTPSRIVIDEYVKITKKFFDNAETGFVHAILDKVANKSQ